MQLFRRDRDALGVIARGSESAFMSLVDRHQSSLMRVAGYWLANDRAAQPWVEETWRTALRQLERYDGKVPLKVWLFSVLVQLLLEQTGADEPVAGAPALDAARFSPAGDRWEGHWRQPPVPWPEPRRVALNVAERTQIDAAIRALPRSHRTVLVLCDVEALANDHVCQLLAIDAETLDQRLHAARSQLRVDLDRYYEQKRARR